MLPLLNYYHFYKGLSVVSWKLSVFVFPLGTYVISPRSVALSATVLQQDVYLLPVQSVNL
jgi:hypothetical protein